MNKLFLKHFLFCDICLEVLCKGFSALERDKVQFRDKESFELEEILFGLLTDGQENGFKL